MYSIAERRNQPGWQRTLNALRNVMAKEGLKLIDKMPAMMTETELHAERKALRQACNVVLDLMKRPENEKDATKVKELSDLFDVAATLVEAINHQFDVNDAAGRTGAGFGASGLGGDRVPILTRNDSFAAAIANMNGLRDLAGGEGRVGFGECIRGMVGFQTRPEVKNTLSEGTDSAGGFTVPTYLMAQIIDKLRAKAVVIQAGALTVPLETQKTSIARLASDPTAAWRAENAAVGGSDPTFEKITFTAQSLACLIKVSRELLEDSVNMESALVNAFINTMALELDRVAMFGSGTPPEPQGFFGLGTINSVSMGTNGAQLTNTTAYPKVLDAMYELELDNNGAPSAFIMHPRTSRTLRGLVDTTNQPLLPPPALKDIPQLVTTAVPVNQVQGTSGAVCSSILSGDFSQLLIGIRSELRIQLLNERFADNLQVGFLVYMRADVQVAHPESFVKLIGILP